MEISLEVLLLHCQRFADSGVCCVQRLAPPVSARMDPVRIRTDALSFSPDFSA